MSIWQKGKYKGGRHKKAGSGGACFNIRVNVLHARDIRPGELGLLLGAFDAWSRM